MKKQYNTLIKSFNKMTRDLISYETSIEELEKRKNKSQKSQKLIFYEINPEIVEKFNSNFFLLGNEIRNFIVKCFGFTIANASTVKVILASNKELLCK